MDFQIKCRSNKISKMSKFKKLVGNSPLYLKNIDLEQRTSLTISELNIQDDGMLILCEVGVYATSQFSLVSALRVGLDETSIQVYK